MNWQMIVLVAGGVLAIIGAVRWYFSKTCKDCDNIFAAGVWLMLLAAFIPKPNTSDGLTDPPPSESRLAVPTASLVCTFEQLRLGQPVLMQDLLPFLQDSRSVDRVANQLGISVNEVTSVTLSNDLVVTRQSTDEPAKKQP